MGFHNAFDALIRRNLIYRRRKWFGALFELGVPIMVIFSLRSLKIAVESAGEFEPTTSPAVLRKDSDVAKPYSFLDYVSVLQAEHKCYNTCVGGRYSDDCFAITNVARSNWPVPFFKCDARRCNSTDDANADALPFCEFNVLALAPSHPSAMERIKAFQLYVESQYPQITNATALPFDYPFLKIFETEQALEKYVTSRDYGGLENPKVGVAIVFSPATKDKEYSYSIRVNSTNINDLSQTGEPYQSTTPPTDRNFDSFAKDDDACANIFGPSLGRNQDSCTFRYIYNGALTIQRLVDDWILHDSGATTDHGYRVAENGVSFAPFPTKEYIIPGFFTTIAGFSAFCVVLGFLHPVSTMIRFIVTEKELRQKELMKMMSVPESAIGLSWFTSFYFCFHGLSALVSATIANSFYEHSDFWLLLIFWQLMVLNTVVFAMAMASCFSKATRAVLIGLLLYFTGYFLTLAVDYKTDSAFHVFSVALHPVTAMSYGLQVLVDLEDAGVGLTLGTLRFSEVPSEYAFLNVLFSLVFDSILWGFLTWYFNRVIPGDYGQPLPWHFPLSTTYWFPRQTAAATSLRSQPTTADGETISFVDNDSIPMEPISDALREQEREQRNVQLYNLTKQFGSQKVAVDSLSLSMYSGHVTALLGHNGAGKTTTISMLTGMLSPTSGYAIVAGNNIATQMNKIREDVGICLQHDCLFPGLTVQEHLELFCRIKGLYKKLPSSEVQAAIATTMEDVALLEKRHTFSKNLSGGMKRKLSVAIAFCGQPKVVFLDEPTSGMDPFSRRFTWNVIRQYKQDRVIVLTTHHMDEADLLGDRIAIMAEGQLRCCGSPLFLKRAYGVGYQLTIEKRQQQGQSASAGSYDDVDVDSKIQTIVQDAVADATLLSNVASEMAFQLPLASSQYFVPMLQRLDAEVDRSNNGGIVGYGVGITTLDEVFLMVARGETGASSIAATTAAGGSGGEGENNAGSTKKTGSTVASTSSSVEERNEEAEFGNDTPTPQTMTMEEALHHSSQIQPDEWGSQTNNDSNLFFRHVRALFAKRAMNFKRDRKAWCWSTVMPSVFALFGFLFVTHSLSSRNMPPLTLSLSQQNSRFVGGTNTTVQNPVPFNAPGNPYSCHAGECITNPVGWGKNAFNDSHTDDSFYVCGGSAYFEIGIRQAQPSCSISKSQDIMSTLTDFGSLGVSQVVSDSHESSEKLLDSVSSFASSQYGALYFTHDQTSTITNDIRGSKDTNYSERAVRTCLEQHSFSSNYSTLEQCNYYRGIGYTVTYNFTALHSSVLYQAVADEVILRHAFEDDSYRIEPTIHPLPITKIERSYAQAQDSFMAWFLLVLSFPFITGAFASFVVAERASKAKHLQTVAGVTPEAYWVSSFLWDIMNYQLPVWAVVIEMLATGIEAFTTNERDVFGGTIALLVLFGPAAAGFTYCMSFAFDSPSYCSLFVVVFNFFIGQVGAIFAYAIALFDAVCDFDPSCDLAELKFFVWSRRILWVMRFIPSFNLGKGLFFIIQVDNLSMVYQEPDISVWSSKIVGGDVEALVIQTVLYIVLAIIIDHLSTKPRVMSVWNIVLDIVLFRWFFRATAYIWSSGASIWTKLWLILRDIVMGRWISYFMAIFQRQDDASDEAIDDDVVAETTRILQPNANGDDLIVIKDLKKEYSNGKVAVNHLSLGIPHGQCFGLLGINGAGKTTTMQILTAEFPPSSGDVLLAGYSVTNEPDKTRRRIGYCPQFDAHFMNMTGREHVELYASIKGVPKRHVRSAASAKLRAVGLNEFDSDRLSARYSGGMKRKLSVACAMIGSPQIVLLDEPSTGMDPVARRSLWKVISGMVAGNSSLGVDPEGRPSVILTTHSMEECEALCPRIGIMAAGKLRCLGSAQHLKTRFGKGFQVEMKVKEANENDDDYKEIVRFIVSNVDLAVSSSSDLEDPIAAMAAENLHLTFDQVLEVTSKLTKDDSIASMITSTDPIGYIIYKSAISEHGIAVSELAAFCVGEIRVKHVFGFFEETYGSSSMLRERQDSKVRYEIQSEDNKLKISSLFASIEENRESLRVAEYGVCQTSLEQIFNAFAAEAEEQRRNLLDRGLLD